MDTIKNLFAGLKTQSRVESIDLLRGIVIVLMALDHTRDYFSIVHFNPVDLTQTNAGYFFTRWITHICAPVFVFLAGTSAFLYGQRASSKNDLSKFLFTRGLWLVFLEFTLVRWGWQFNWDYSYSWVQVIWALGISMIVLSVLIYLPNRWIALFGIGMILFHNTFDGIKADELGSFRWLWLFLHEEGIITFGESGIFWITYPLVPWIGVMAAGYVFGQLYLLPEKERNRYLLRIGSFLTILFFVIRGINIYGDPQPWSGQNNFLFSVLSFLNCEKYPPSLSFLLMTLGPSILLLAFLDKLKKGIKNFFLVFGRTPLFFYLIHVPVIHFLSVMLAVWMGYDTTFHFNNSDPATWPVGFGFNLPGIYAVWIFVVLLLYPLCKWFAKLKAEKKNKWLSYL